MVFEKTLAKLDEIVKLAEAGPAPAAAAAPKKEQPKKDAAAAPAGGKKEQAPPKEKKEGGAAPAAAGQKPAVLKGKGKPAGAEGGDDAAAAGGGGPRFKAPHPTGPVVVRFAPSPTGYLHIGGARTALFNYLYAKRFGGRFLLRIEDTDRERSDDKAVDAIFQGLRWLGIQWEGEPTFQFARMKRHAEVAHDLLAKGKAYKCFATPEELDEMRKEQMANKLPPRYDGRWRERDPATAPPGATYVVRLKSPMEGKTTVFDHVMGPVTVDNKETDDMVLLRSDGTPTYMLSVVVDDHDMGITHVIRGVDHLTNTFRQMQLYDACGWTSPQFAHIPLIHGPDGKKLSKRHGATGAEQYEAMGYLPEGITSYLMKLGWSNSTQEIFTLEEAAKVFDLDEVNRSAANLDFNKLADVNAHYLQKLDNSTLHTLLQPFIQRKMGDALTPKGNERILAAMDHLKSRAKTLEQLAANSVFIASETPVEPDAAGQKVLDKAILADLAPVLAKVETWDIHTLETLIRDFSTQKDVKMAKVAQPLRVAITGSSASPPLFDMMVILGKESSLARVEHATK